MQVITKNANKADELLRDRLTREAGNRVCLLHLFVFNACQKTGFNKELWLNFGNYPFKTSWHAISQLSSPRRRGSRKSIGEMDPRLRGDDNRE
jgi:hypothetical protein